MARSATGLLLQPTTPADGDLFRIRVEPSSTKRPGRGLHVSDGVATGIQVALPEVALPQVADARSDEPPVAQAVSRDPLKP
jgi:hypothetical protein